MLGTMPKSAVHGANTPLHRAFSSYVFSARDKRLLLQQRSHKKKTWPLIWSNSCCGHPTAEESNVNAANRRLEHELGLRPILLEEVAPYRYCFSRNGVMENEICPILVGLVEHEPVPNPNEVEAVRWIEWRVCFEGTERHGRDYTEWCVEQARILEHTSRARKLIGF